VRSLLEEGTALLREGSWRAAHEVFESGWRASGGPVRELFQALAQLGAAMLKWSEGRATPAETLLRRARGHLDGLPSRLHSCDVEELDTQLRGLEERLALGEPAPAGLHLGVAEPRAPSSDIAAIEASCPYCGESVTVRVDPTGARAERYVEDCPVCCRPWAVEVSLGGGTPSVELHREDD
jgi:hypothetical protein